MVITVVSFWQHEMVMNEAARTMPMHELMMFWMSVPATAASLMLIAASIAIYLANRREAGGAGVVGLNERERMVVDYLIERGGAAEQREIAKMLGLTRLQAHRVISSLREKCR